MDSKISIIVPIYNVEEYLARCLESIIHQTYNNIEIILVDDGSLDNCGKICDKYAKKDKRIKVIHKENGGLSAARNSGFKISTGEYIMFVDSDDWIDYDMVKKLITNIKKYDSDIAICGVKKIIDDRINLMEWYNEEICFNTNEALEALVENNEVKSFAWNKIYKKYLFDKYEWPENKIYEDVRIMHAIFRECKTISIVPDYLYNYYQRKNSIDNLPSLRNKLELIFSFKDRYNYMKNEKLPYDTKILYQIAILSIENLMKNRFSKEDIKKYKKELKDNKRYCNSNDMKRAIKHHASLKEKIEIKIYSLFSINGYYPLKFIKKFYGIYTKLKKNKPKDYELEILENISKSQKNKILLFGSPEYDNLGDHAIAYSTKKYITDKFKEFDFFEITENIVKNNISNLKRIIKDNDIILLQGGGNMGDIYPDIEEIRKITINNFPKNKVIVMPQTIHFYNNNISLNYYNKDNVSIYAREQKSYDIMNNKFETNINLVPDIVLYLIKYADSYLNIKRNGCLLCLRNDKEKNNSISKNEIIDLLKEQEINYNNISTLASGNVPIINRKVNLQNLIKSISNSKIVITDRLHGMILCVITKTPCIVLPSFNHKVVESYKWVTKFNYIKLCNNIEDIKNNISLLENIVPVVDYNLLDKYNILEKEIGGNNEKIY